jgi:integrase
MEQVTMSDTHLTTPSTPDKPAKPRPDYPLFAHAAGVWAKKIRGKLHYFGPWADPDGALKKYLEQKDALHAGRTPRPDPDGLTVKDVCNAFLRHKQALVDSSELSPRTWLKYKQVTDLLIDQLGKTRRVDDLGPEDFAAIRKRMVQRWGALRVRDIIQHIRSVFKHALEAGLTDKPMRFGPGFQRPSKKTLRLERAAAGPRMFEAEEIRRLLGSAGVTLGAMILLGVNAGLGNSDAGLLPLSALDLERGWLNYPRRKTGIPRRCPLWPETVQAIKQALAQRPAPKNEADSGFVFITKYGLPWSRDNDPGVITKEFRKLMDALAINGHRNFYGLRHSFETIGGEAKDQVAVGAIMGHADERMSAVYRERISDERLKAVTDHVRMWLFGASQTAVCDAATGDKSQATAV